MEPWVLDLKRVGNQFSGTYTRKALPLPSPITANGKGGGHQEIRADGTRKIFLYLNEAVTNASGAASGTVNQNLSLILIARNNEIIQSWALAGRMNQSAHEVDPSAQTERKYRVGEAIILLHDDRNTTSIRFAKITRISRAGRGGLLAVQIKLSANQSEQQMTRASSLGW